jgi:hypothetical protein
MVIKQNKSYLEKSRSSVNIVAFYNRFKGVNYRTEELGKANELILHVCEEDTAPQAQVQGDARIRRSLHTIYAQLPFLWTIMQLGLASRMGLFSVFLLSLLLQLRRSRRRFHCNMLHSLSWHIFSTD